MQGAVGMEQVCLHRADRTPQSAGDGFQGELLVVTQVKHGALAGCQGGKSSV